LSFVVTLGGIRLDGKAAVSQMVGILVGSVFLCAAALGLVYGIGQTPTVPPAWNRAVFPASLLVSVVFLVLGIYLLDTA
jgi:hypothetical protein